MVRSLRHLAWVILVSNRLTSNKSLYHASDNFRLILLVWYYVGKHYQRTYQKRRDGVLTRALSFCSHTTFIEELRRNIEIDTSVPRIHLLNIGYKFTVSSGLSDWKPSGYDSSSYPGCIIGSILAIRQRNAQRRGYFTPTEWIW